jgi:hypothetical protein
MTTAESRRRPGAGPDVDRLVGELEQIAAAARQTFGHLNVVQLNWQPSPGEWSIAQCFEHLILVNSAYFPLLRRIARGEHRPTLRERLPLLPVLFGKAVLKAVQPDATRKVQARPAFRPSSSAIDPRIIDRFVGHQVELGRHMRATADRDARAIIVTSPVMKILTYSLFDAYRIIVAHERQHLGQAERVLAEAEFPRATPATAGA